MASNTVAIVCIGMAGSGKTTFMQRINSHLHAQRAPPYVINLDPAVRTVPFECNIDIRESIDYKEVMRQYNLGPNGGILTSLNLFATKVDQIVGILEKRCGIVSAEPEADSETAAADGGGDQTTHGSAPQTSSASDHTQASPSQTSTTNPPISHILLDTPGQIEVFVWSASGQILLSSLASTFPTVIAYIIDTPRTTSTSTFMSNMLYACSILYKTKLPMILVFNKTDVQDARFAKEWMTDFEAFQAALKREEEGEGSSSFGGTVGGGSGYMSSLLNSMSLVLEEFYRALSVVGVSAMTGAGVPEFFTAVEEKRLEFERDYRPELERRRKEKQKEQGVRREKELGRLMRDLNVEPQGGDANPRASSTTQTRGMMGRPSTRTSTRTGTARERQRKPEPETISDLEDNSEHDLDRDSDSDGMASQPDADLVDPDAEDSDGEHGGDADDGSLADRYQRALKGQGQAQGHGGGGGGTGGGGGADPEDASFARYIRTANVNR